ncbi:MAG: CPBP family intramembrane metalloprotease [Syntrophobacteraceae bacterium]|nr:CPBP family intramembrane metalloprotease [Syntrophobacteraceae bacterium]
MNTWQGSMVVLAAAAGIAVSAVTGMRNLELYVLTFLILGLAAAAMKKVQAIHITLFCFFLSLFYIAAPPFLHTWPFRLLLPLVLYAMATLSIPALRRSVFWLRLGRLDRRTLSMVMITCILSGVFLVLWVVLLEPSMDVYAGQVPKLPLWALVLSGIFFALFNAAIEEAVFRGIFLQAMDSTPLQGRGALIVQGALFGLMHFAQGFPRGIEGAIMAGAYGMALGSLCRMSGGLLAPWIAHVFADIVIFALIIHHMPKAAP